MPPSDRSLRLTLLGGTPLAGAFLFLGAPDVAEVMASAGLPLLIVDREHAAADLSGALHEFARHPLCLGRLRPGPRPRRIARGDQAAAGCGLRRGDGGRRAQRGPGPRHRRGGALCAPGPARGAVHRVARRRLRGRDRPPRAGKRRAAGGGDDRKPRRAGGHPRDRRRARHRPAVSRPPGPDDGLRHLRRPHLARTDGRPAPGPRRRSGPAARCWGAPACPAKRHRTFSRAAMPWSLPPPTWACCARRPTARFRRSSPDGWPAPPRESGCAPPA